MFGKTKNYILNTAGLADTDFDLVGREALAAAVLSQVGVATPQGFVLTSEAFDDFVTTAGIVDSISTALTVIDPEDPSTITKASNTITQLIMQASFPATILNPLVQAYKSLSGFSEKYVAVKPSWILDEELLPTSYNQYVRLNVKGDAALLYAVKQMWAGLFSEDALSARARMNYRGGLTVSVLIQKMIQGEISGRGYSLEPATNDHLIVIEAILGLDRGVSQEILPDIYKVDPGDLRIIEKNIVSQDFMILRKGRAKPEEDPNMQVPISPDWRRRQKLSDNYIIELARLVQKLSEHYQHPLEIQWAFETGQLYVISAIKSKPLNQPDEGIQPLVDSTLADVPLLPVVPVAVIPEKEVNAKSKPHSISSLASEIDNIVSSQQTQGQPQEAVIEKPTTLTLTCDDLLTNIYLDVSDMGTDKLANSPKFDGIYLDGTQVVLRQGILPESISSDRSRLSGLIESYSQEISSAARMIEPRPVFYSFSDIGDKEKEKLTGVRSQQQSLNGCERFQLHPEAMIAEILAIKRAKTNYGVKNVKLVLPRLRSEHELVDMKKILSMQNVHRTSIQLFAEVAAPSFVYELSEIEYSILDGVLINFLKYAQALTGRTEIVSRDYQTVFQAVRTMLEEYLDPKISALILVPNDKDIITSALEMHIGGLIFNQIPDNSLLEAVKDLESHTLTPQPAKRRGRKIKPL